MTENTRDAAASDTGHMRRAIALAERGWGQTAPNPMVGAVLVRDGEVVGEGFHTRFGEAHAEVEALRVAGSRAQGATLYVSLEPCNHHGKTPPCSDAVIAAGISRVVIAARDPTAIAAGGAAKLLAAGIDVSIGTEESAARELNAEFFHAQTSARSFVTLKLALSLDAAIADSTHAPGWLTGSDARRYVHYLRAGHDAVAVGLGTVQADDPMLTVRDSDIQPRVSPVRIVFDTSARLPIGSRLVQTARDHPTLVVCWAPDPAHATALEQAGVRLVHAATLSDALVALRERGIRSVLVEGGAALARSFLEDALVDRLIIFRAPVLLGAGALAAFSGLPGMRANAAPRWRLVRSRQFGDDEMSIYAPPHS